MLPRFHCLMLSKTDYTTKSSFTVHATRLLSSNTRKVIIAIFTYIRTSVGSSVQCSLENAMLMVGCLSGNRLYLQI